MPEVGSDSLTGALLARLHRVNGSIRTTTPVTRACAHAGQLQDRKPAALLCWGNANTTAFKGAEGTALRLRPALEPRNEKSTPRQRLFARA
jgi:hypothetical protein